MDTQSKTERKEKIGFVSVISAGPLFILWFLAFSISIYITTIETKDISIILGQLGLNLGL